MGTFTYSGQSAILSVGYPILAAVGTFAMVGQPVNFTVVIFLGMPAGLGTFAYTGQPARATLSLASFPPSGGASVKVTATSYRA